METYATEVAISYTIVSFLKEFKEFNTTDTTYLVMQS